MRNSDLPTSNVVKDSSNHILSFLCVFINRPSLFLTLSPGSLPDKNVNQTNGSEKHSIRHVKFLTCSATVAPFTDSFPLPSSLNLPLTCLSCHSHSQRLSVSRSLSTVSTRVCLQLVPQQAGKPFGEESLNRSIHTSVDSLMHFRVLQPFLNRRAEFLVVHLIVPPFRLGPPASLEVLSFVFWLILQTIIN